MTVTSIIHDGKQISLDDALELAEFPLLYDPLGRYDETSDPYIVAQLQYLVNFGFIDSYEVDEPPVIPPVPRGAKA